ncbi:MAG: hypothetical protein ABSB89_04760 [Candidatus Bathyarchaeia archaeon]
MNLRKALSKKYFKFVILVAMAALIGTASAAVYYSVLMQPSVTITGATVIFVSGDDWPIGSILGTNSTWVSLALQAYPNATLTYDQPLNISNTDTSSHLFRLRNISILPASGMSSVSNFTAINFIVEDTAGTEQAEFFYNTTGTTWNTPATTGYMTLPASTTWIISVQTTAAPGASSTAAANLVISVDVQ